MKQQAKLYKEYLSWVDKRNEKGIREWEAQLKKDKKRRVQAKNLHKKELKEYKAKNDRIVEEYESLPWYEKMFIDDPRSEFGFGWLRKPKDYSWYSIPFCFYMSAERESQEGFMRWLIDKKYKL